MNLEYLGDALDFWKGSLLDVLRTSEGLKGRVHVLPMFSDPEREWTPSRLMTYASFLRARPNDIITREPVPRDATARKQYFTQAPDDKDDHIFLDPNTGIAPASASTKRPRPEHVTPSEVKNLAKEYRVVAVYQHRSRSSRDKVWIRQYTRRLSGVEVVSYVAAQVGMIFVTTSIPDRDAVHEALSECLGAASGRIV